VSEPRTDLVKRKISPIKMKGKVQGQKTTPTRKGMRLSFSMRNSGLHKLKEIPPNGKCLSECMTIPKKVEAIHCW